MSSLREAAARLFAILEEQGFVFAVGGSFASSLHSVPRATQDIDVVVDLSLNRIAGLHRALIPEFYADDEMMKDAIRRGRAFNVIHAETGYKFDIFAAGAHPIGREQLDHSRYVETALLGGDPLSVPVVSAEDIILAKLLWYHEGGGVSERQWNDLMNLAQVQAAILDKKYLERQALRIGVSALLARLLQG